MRQILYHVWNLSNDIESTRQHSYKEKQFDLYLGQGDLNISNENILSRSNNCAKFGNSQAKGSKDVKRNLLCTELPTDRCKPLCPLVSMGGQKNINKKQHFSDVSFDVILKISLPWASAGSVPFGTETKLSTLTFWFWSALLQQLLK